MESSKPGQEDLVVLEKEWRYPLILKPARGASLQVFFYNGLNWNLLSYRVNWWMGFFDSHFCAWFLSSCLGFLVYQFGGGQWSKLVEIRGPNISSWGLQARRAIMGYSRCRELLLPEGGIQRRCLANDFPQENVWWFLKKSIFLPWDFNSKLLFWNEAISNHHCPSVGLRNRCVVFACFTW